MKNILDVEKITTGYNGCEIIKNISFSVRSGEILGIIGPNGSGKTTLMRVISRVLSPWQGKIYYDTNNISEIPIKKLFQEISVLPQVVEVPFSFKVFDVVSMGRFPHLKRFEQLKENDLQIVEKVMSFTDISHLSNKDINHISGGERQRVFLAQSLAQQPKLLLLDEPTTHLDIGHQIEILNLIKMLNRENNLTIIMILHDLNLASEYCDRLLLIDDGKLYKIGTPADVVTYQNIKQIYKTVIIVKENPISKKPHLILVSEADRTGNPV